MTFDPKAPVRDFMWNQSYETLRTACFEGGELFIDPMFNMDKEGHPYKRPKELCDFPWFVSGRHDRYDALQGAGSDCWMIAAMDVLTLHGEVASFVAPNQSFYDRYAGIFHFRIWQLGTWYDVVVDDRLPVFPEERRLKFCHSKSGQVFWAALLEKAYAKVVSLRNNWEVSYHWVFTPSMSNPLNALQDFTGGIVEHIETSVEQYDARGANWYWLMNELINTNTPMTCHYTYDRGGTPLGLYGRHTYAVLRQFNATTDPRYADEYPGFILIRVFNPWGNTEWTGWYSDADYHHWKYIDARTRRMLGIEIEVLHDDGEFWMTIEDFLRYFERVFVCHLGPALYFDSYRAFLSFRKWTTLTVTGEWVPGESSGGSGRNKHENPQYMLCVKKMNPGELYNVLIELVQHFKLEEKYKPAISMYVYRLQDSDKLPVGDILLNVLESMIGEPKYEGRSLNTKLKLKPGRYLLLPVTAREGDEGQFVIRVYAGEDSVSLECEASDVQVSKSAQTEEANLQDCDEDIERLFAYVSGGQEVDWTGLKKILDVAMKSLVSKTETDDSAVWSLFNSIAGVLKKYFSNETSDETNDAFTKDECRMMVAMLDDDHSGKLSFSEFSNLWRKIKFWTKVYEQYRDEAEGFLKKSQLQDALSSIGYNISKRTVRRISIVYTEEHGHIMLTDFILCGIALDTALTLCKKAGVEEKNKNEITLSLEEWVRCTLNL